MENKDILNPGEDFASEDLPETFPELVLQPEEDLPLIQELPMESPAQETDLLPEENIPEEDEILPEVILPEKSLPESAENLPEEPAPIEDPSFMDQIPNAESDFPTEEQPVISGQLSDPVPAVEILPDEHAMDSHGMLEHGEEEPPFDLSILDDPELAEPAAE